MALTNRGGRSSARAVVLTRGYGDRTARRSCQKGTVTPTTPASSTKKRQSLKEPAADRRPASWNSWRRRSTTSRTGSPCGTNEGAVVTAPSHQGSAPMAIRSAVLQRDHDPPGHGG